MQLSSEIILWFWNLVRLCYVKLQKLKLKNRKLMCQIVNVLIIDFPYIKSMKFNLIWIVKISAMWTPNMRNLVLKKGVDGLS